MKRLERAKNEVKFVGRYDYVVLNDDIENAVQSIQSILVAERLKFKRNKDILKTLT